MLVASVTAFAQKDVTHFLGIPVDGFKHDMIRELKAKGFVSSSHDKDVLEGEFNGTQVEIHVLTNNNRVYRIAVVDVGMQNETDIRIRFNKLCRQFENNGKYISFGNYIIDEDEDISYEITVNKKRYEAVFYQKAQGSDPDSVLGFDVNRTVWFMISDSYSKYYITMFYDNEYNRANGEEL